MAPRSPAALRARRMLALLPHLRPDAELPLERLAAALGATAAELAADIELLSMCGAAPYTPDVLVSAFVEDDGVVRAYADPPALERRVRLTAAEARALSAALELAGVAPDDPLLGRLAEVTASAEAPERLVATAMADGAIEVYERVAAAIESREKIAIEYWTASRGTTARRIVHPLALGYERGSWYLAAYCETAEGRRTFRLDRVREVEPTGEGFGPAEAPAPRAFDGTGMSLAEVGFAPGEEVAARDWPGATFERQADGSVLARIPYSGTAWLARRVAARFGAAEVLSPPELRDAVARLAAAEAPRG